MTVVGLHPEELFDKLLAGEISPAEHERLRQHLAVCSVCRFEWEVRGDFQEEALTLDGNGPPPLLPLRLPPAAVRPVRRRRPSRLLVWGVAAAALITAGAAVASSVVAGKPPWRSVSSIFSRAATPATQPAPGTSPASRARSGCKGADCAPAAKSAESAAAASVAVVPAQAPEQVEAPTRARGAAPIRSGFSPSRLGRQASVSQAEAAASTSEPVPPAAGAPRAQEPASAAALFADANAARRSGDIGRASGLYHLLQQRFAGSAEAELSRVTLALLLLDSGDAQGALVGFERYLAGSSRALEAEALVGRARALARLGRKDLEASAWREVRRKYPRSVYGRQASERLAALGRR